MEDGGWGGRDTADDGGSARTERAGSPDSSDGDGGMSTGALIGIIAGAVIGVVGVVCVVMNMIACRRRPEKIAAPAVGGTHS